MMQNPGASQTPVTVIGLGLMGQALAGAFLRSRHPTTVWNRTAAKADQLVAQGARLAGSPGDAVAASPLIIVCVSDYDAVHELLDPLAKGEGGVLDGRVLVNLTSGTSALARETARWADRQGSTYLDGAILAIPPAIGTPDAVILYSGPRPSFEAHAWTLKRLGTATYLGGDHGLSSLYDVAMLSLMWNILNGFLQGAALLGIAGVDAKAFAPMANQGIQTMTDWVSTYAKQVDDGAYPADDSTIGTHRAAMDHLVHESESLGVNAELPRFLRTMADRAVADGYGGNSYAAMIEQFRKPPGKPSGSGERP